MQSPVDVAIATASCSHMDKLVTQLQHEPARRHKPTAASHGHRCIYLVGMTVPRENDT